MDYSFKEPVPKHIDCLFYIRYLESQSCKSIIVYPKTPCNIQRHNPLFKRVLKSTDSPKKDQLWVIILGRTITVQTGQKNIHRVDIKNTEAIITSEESSCLSKFDCITSAVSKGTIYRSTSSVVTDRNTGDPRVSAPQGVCFIVPQRKHHQTFSDYYNYLSNQRYKDLKGYSTNFTH